MKVSSKEFDIDIRRDKAVLIRVYKRAVQSDGVLIIPGAISEIAPCAIENLKTCTEIFIDENVETIHPHGIYNMPNLKKISMDLSTWTSLQKDEHSFSTCPCLEMVWLRDKKYRQETMKQKTR